MKLSVVIPAYNEEGSIQETVLSLFETLSKFKIEHEIIVVNDNSKDNTLNKLEELFKITGPNGFGNAVKYGLERFEGDCVAIMMADLSDDPLDLVKFYHKMLVDNLDCVFGSRFIKGGRVIDYPFPKYVINRIANTIIKVIIGTKYNDATNAFKLYKKETINGLKPLLSPHFNLTIELSLKSIVRGYTFTILPNSWTNRKSGESKLKIKEMGSRYFFILIYCFVEKYFSRGDFKKQNNANNY